MNAVLPLDIWEITNGLCLNNTLWFRLYCNDSCLKGFFNHLEKVMRANQHKHDTEGEGV